MEGGPVAPIPFHPTLLVFDEQYAGVHYRVARRLDDGGGQGHVCNAPNVRSKVPHLPNAHAQSNPNGSDHHDSKKQSTLPSVRENQVVVLELLADPVQATDFRDGDLKTRPTSHRPSQYCSKIGFDLVVSAKS
jgi:hypothetical protein